MRPAFPASDYYGPSVPSRRHQPTASLPTATRRRRDGQRRNGSHVHHVSIDGVGAQLFPLQHRHEYAAGLPHGLTTGCIRPASEFPPANAGGARCAPAIHQVAAGVTLEGVQPLVHFRYAFPSRSASTGPSGGASPPRLRRGCSRPRPRFRGQTAASFIRAAATARRRSPFISARFVAPRGAQSRVDAHRRPPRKPLDLRQPAACRARTAGASLLKRRMARSDGGSRCRTTYIDARSPVFTARRPAT
jgi:hypothetical protein